MKVVGGRSWSIADFCLSNGGAPGHKIWRTADGNYEFQVQGLRNGAAVGSPCILGVLRDGILNWFLETNDHLSFDNQCAALVASMAGQELQPIPLKGEWCVLNAAWSGNFYHWIQECLVKVCFLEVAGYRGNYLVPRRKFVDESMEMLGIAPDRIHIAADHGKFDFYYEIETLLVCDRFNGAVDLCRAKGLGRYFRDWVLERIGVTGEPVRRTYIARDHYRVVENEAELAQVLDRHGFDRVYMDALPLKEQIATAARSQILVAANGAGLTHALFLPDKASVVELASPYYANTCIMSIANSLRHKYYGISSVSDESSYDIKVPIDVVDTLVRTLIAGQEDGHDGNRK
ncbi:MAG: glycosyltransferase family 61 protein [Alphaproteobacteria bacterium]